MPTVTEDTPPPSPTARRDRRILLVLLGVIGLGLGLHGRKAVTKSRRADFERYYYAGLVASRSGDLYRVTDDREFKYFPIFAQCMAPLARTTEWMAGDGRIPLRPDAHEDERGVHYDRALLLGGAVWYALLCACYLGSVALAVGMVRPQTLRDGLWIAFAAILFSGRFFASNIHNGQINMVVMFFAVLGCWLVLRGRERLGGASVALAACLKFMPVVLLLWFLRRRMWRAAAYSLLTMLLLLTVVPAVTWGWSGNLRLLGGYIGARHRMVTGLPEDHAAGQSLPSLTNRLLRKVNAAPLRLRDAEETEDRSLHKLYINIADLSPQTAKRIALALVVLTLALSLWCVRGRLHEPPVRAALEAGLFFLVLLLISPEARKAHYVTILVPAAALAGWALRTGVARWMLAPAGLAFLLMGLSSRGIVGDTDLYYYLNGGCVVLWGAVLLFVWIAAVLRRLPATPAATPSDVR